MNEQTEMDGRRPNDCIPWNAPAFGHRLRKNAIEIFSRYLRYTVERHGASPLQYNSPRRQLRIARLRFTSCRLPIIPIMLSILQSQIGMRFFAGLRDVIDYLPIDMFSAQPVCFAPPDAVDTPIGDSRRKSRWN